MPILVCIFLAVLTVVFTACAWHATNMAFVMGDRRYKQWAQAFLLLAALSFGGSIVWLIRIIHDANH